MLELGLHTVQHCMQCLNCIASTPEIVACNIAKVESLSTSALLCRSNCYMKNAASCVTAFRQWYRGDNFLGFLIPSHPPKQKIRMPPFWGRTAQCINLRNWRTLYLTYNKLVPIFDQLLTRSPSNNSLQ